MKYGLAPWAGAPSWPAFAVLTALVIAAHALILQGQPAHWGPEGDAAAASHRPFITRTIAPSPVTPTAKPPPAKPARPVTPKPAGTPKSTPNQAAAPDSSAPTAINSIANQAPAEAPPEQAVAQAPAAEPPPAPSPAAAEVSIADSVRLEYDVTGLSKNLTYRAQGKLNWQREGDNYEAKMVVSAFLLGSRSMSSTGRVTPQGLAPQRFSDKARSEQAAHFQPDKGKITFSANTPDAPWTEGAQDRLSVFFQLAGLLAGNPAKFRPESTLALYTADSRKAETWVFMVAGEETLTLPAGEFATIKLTRRPQQEFDRKVEAWFAPSLGYLPVRIKITEQNGDFLDQQLNTVVKP